MISVAVHNVAAALADIFTSVADRAARASGFVRRQSKFDGQALVQTLTFGWLRNPNMTLEELAQMAASIDVSISPQGIDQRFGPRAADCLLLVLQEAVRRVMVADPVASEILQRFPGGVCLLDSTTLTLPDALASHWAGCGGSQPCDGRAALKLFARWNLLNGELHGPTLHAGRVADQNCDAPLGPLLPGTLRLGDLGFFDLDRFRELSDGGVYWLTRIQPGTAIYDEEGRAWSLADLLSRQTPDMVDRPVTLGRRQRLPCRLLAVRVPAHVAKKRRERLRQLQKHKGRRYRRPDPWILADWTVFATNVPLEMLSVSEAVVLGRCRWQIELLWKLWKNEGRIDESRSKKPWRILCEIYAKLLGMVVQHWILLISCWSFPDRSLVRTSRAVRAHVSNLAILLPQRHLVCRTLEFIRHLLKRGGRIAKRKHDPPTHQLLANLSKAG